MELGRMRVYERLSITRKIPTVLTATEQKAILKQPNPRYLTGQRNKMMIQLMLNTASGLMKSIL
jgi:site-specific recombinase XerD